MKKLNIRPTDSELAILQLLWKNGPSSVREVNELLNTETRTVGYTTTLKIMQIMTEKEMVVRDTSKRTHIYTAAIKEKDTKNNMVKDLINNAFSGSARSLVLQALGSQNTSKADLEEIKTLIDQLQKNNKNGNS